MLEIMQRGKQNSIGRCTNARASLRMRMKHGAREEACYVQALSKGARDCSSIDAGARLCVRGVGAQSLQLCAASPRTDECNKRGVSATQSAGSLLVAGTGTKELARVRRAHQRRTPRQGRTCSVVCRGNPLFCSQSRPSRCTRPSRLMAAAQVHRPGTTSSGMPNRCHATPQGQSCAHAPPAPTPTNTH